MGIRKEGAYMSNIFMLNEAKFISSFDLRFQDGIVKTFVLNCNLGENDFAVLSSMDVLSEKECSQVYEEILDDLLGSIEGTIIPPLVDECAQMIVPGEPIKISFERGTFYFELTEDLPMSKRIYYFFYVVDILKELSTM